jgi:hypothetical protein
LDIGLIWLNFFDDSPTLCPSNVNHVTISYQTPIQFTLLTVGRQSGEKDLEFAADFGALGAVLDISKREQGLSQVLHKPKRASEVEDRLYDVLAEGPLSATLAASLRVKLQFTESATLEMLSEVLIEFSDMRTRSSASF